MQCGFLTGGEVAEKDSDERLTVASDFCFGVLAIYCVWKRQDNILVIALRFYVFLAFTEPLSSPLPLAPATSHHNELITALVTF